MPDTYEGQLDFLTEEIGIKVTPSAEEYALRLSSRLHKLLDEVDDDDIEDIQRFFILKGAEICATLNIDQSIEDGQFKEPVLLQQKDMQITALTSFCRCIPNAECSKPKNALTYVSNFSGDVAKLIAWTEGTEVDRLAEIPAEEIEDMLVEDLDDYSHIPGQLRGWFGIKARLWKETAEIIIENPIFAEDSFWTGD